MSMKQNVMEHDPLAILTEPDTFADTVTDDNVGALREDVSEMHTAVATDEKNEPEDKMTPGLAAFGFPEQLGIEEVDGVHAQLIGLLDSGENVLLDAADIGVIDGAGMQLLAAFFKDAVDRQISVEWIGASDALKTAAKIIGLDGLLRLQQAA